MSSRFIDAAVDGFHGICRPVVSSGFTDFTPQLPAAACLHVALASSPGPHRSTHLGTGAMLNDLKAFVHTIFEPGNMTSMFKLQPRASPPGENSCGGPHEFAIRAEESMLTCKLM
eukprot:TRINITY_DN9015_c0_g1_i1.p3 TRINITY_DN9015_c0_g1~~TRINITY_DN9015_c0_g1_i1.p3  ORF type:complete len:115 (-),score=8.03 TRINITY_DN9015_c0_g1_i1:376-720(-)